MIRRPPRSTLFPSTPLFRSVTERAQRPRVPQQPADRVQPHLAQPRVLVPREQGLLSLPQRKVHVHPRAVVLEQRDRKSTRLNSSHANISYAVFCLKKNKNHDQYLPLCSYAHFQSLDRLSDPLPHNRHYHPPINYYLHSFNSHFQLHQELDYTPSSL